jgi:hypothetical protein
MKIDARRFHSFMQDYRDNLKRAIPSALMSAGEKARALILNRTSRGIGLNGRFKRYDTKYAKYRSKKGKGSTPNLSFSGDMLGSLSVTKTKTTSVLVHFKNRKEAKKAAYNNKKRPFFGIKPEEKKLVAAAFKDQLERKL